MVAIRSSKTQVAKALRGVDLTGIRARLVNAENQVLAESALALILQGKDKPTYLPSRDHGDVCVIIHAEKVLFTGKKWDEKLYRWHSGYPGGLRERTAKDVFSRKPEDIIWRAVSGMLPKNHLREARLRKLLIFPGDHNLTDVELVQWKMPENIAKKLKDRRGKTAPRLKR